MKITITPRHPRRGGPVEIEYGPETVARLAGPNPPPLMNVIASILAVAREDTEAARRCGQCAPRIAGEWPGQAQQGEIAKRANQHPACDDCTPDSTCWECMEDHLAAERD